MYRGPWDILWFILAVLLIIFLLRALGAGI